MSRIKSKPTSLIGSKSSNSFGTKNILSAENLLKLTFLPSFFTDLAVLFQKGYLLAVKLNTIN